MPANQTTMVMRPGLAILTGYADPIPIRWVYRTANPFAITLAIRACSGEWVEWRFLRELMAGGLLMPTGGPASDIQLRPDGAAVRIDLRSPDGRATVLCGGRGCAPVPRADLLPDPSWRRARRSPTRLP